MSDDQQREAAESAVYDVLMDDENEGVDAFDLACKIVAALAPVQPDPLRAGVEVFLREYASANWMKCGVCSGHSPSWDGHSGCQTAAIEHLSALLVKMGA